jgi:methionyl-tRNA formyltransferase
MAGLRLAFMGTPDFAIPALRVLLAAGHDLAAVYTQPPRRAGRGRKERRSPVHELALSHGLEVRTPASLKTAAVQADFAALKLDAAVVVAYGQILPPAILKAPRLGCVNVHASLLPRWRGAAPIQRAIMAGDTQTGVTIMLMDEGLDTGPLLLDEAVPIAPDATAGDLHDCLAKRGAPLLLRALAGLADGTLSPRPQPATGACYAPKIDKAEARIDWRRPADEIDRLIRGLSPSPGAWFEAAGARIKVLRAEPVAGSGAPGMVIGAPLSVACGAGALALTLIQRAGKGPMAAEDFVRGFSLPKRLAADDAL